MRRRSRVIAVIAALVLALFGYGLLDTFDLVPGVLTLARPASTTPGAADRGPAKGTGARHVPVSRALAPLKGLNDAAPMPTVPALAAYLHQALRDQRLGNSVGATVRDAITGKHLLDFSADKPLTPASTTKLLTATAVTSTLDLESTFTTKAVQGGTARDIVLVAGGDSLLSPDAGDPHAVSGRAGLGDLAAQVAASLKGAAGSGPFHLSVDDRYAVGPAFAPGWQPDTITMGYTGAVAMLGLSTQRVVSGRPSPRDPVANTAAAFRAALAKHGVAVDTRVGRTAARAHAKQLGAVSSAPVGRVLALALDDSDNALTEQLARQAAVKAHQPATFRAVATWVLGTVKALGVNTSGARLADSCGLSEGTVIPARVLGDIVERAASGRQPGLEGVLSRLPVAALSGTLDDRFLGADAASAVGVARAKTGSLPGVNALAGTVVDHDGRLLVFAVVVDNVRPLVKAAGKAAQSSAPERRGSKGVSSNAWVAAHDARAALDRLVARLSQCGCR